MSCEQKNGFSLTEVLLSVGILSIGMIFIAGVFPAAIYLTAISTERSIAAAADEAFAKIKVYDVNDWTDPNFAAGRTVPVGSISKMTSFEFLYPSIGTNFNDKQYYWSALCRQTGLRDVQVTVFVCRKVGSGLNWQVPVPVVVSSTAKPDEISISNVLDKTFINDGYTVVENTSGQIYRVLERYADTTVLKLDRKWLGGSLVWVVPAPAGGGRYPCVAVYQKVIRF